MAQAPVSSTDGGAGSRFGSIGVWWVGVLKNKYNLILKILLFWITSAVNNTITCLFLGINIWQQSTEHELGSLQNVLLFKTVTSKIYIFFYMKKK